MQWDSMSVLKYQREKNGERIFRRRVEVIGWKRNLSTCYHVLEVTCCNVSFCGFWAGGWGRAGYKYFSVLHLCGQLKLDGTFI